MPPINPSGSRFEISSEHSSRSLCGLAGDSGIEVLQFSTPLSDSQFDVLNEEFFSKRPEVEFRAYGFYGQSCDLSFCARMSNVERFRADCLQSAVHVEQIGAMRKLRLLGIGIFDLESFSLLEGVTEELEHLNLGETRSKKPDLAPLGRFKTLRVLGLTGQQKNIEVLRGHSNLEEMWCSVSMPSAALFRSLPKLWSLRLMLGGTRNLAALGGMESLKYLEICRVSRMTDLEFVSSLGGLQHLSLQDLPHIGGLPDLSRMTALRKISLENLKGLRDVSAMEAAPRLEELVHISSRGEPGEYVPLLRGGRLKFARVGFGSVAKNERFERLCGEYGVAYDVNRGFAVV